MKQVMFLVIVALVSCKKTVNDVEENNTTTTLKAKEFGTGIPLSGVTIELYKCSYYDLVFGCQSTSHFATYYTNADGECKISDNILSKADEGILYKKSQYWDTKAGEAMEPEAFVDVSMKAGKTYPDTLELRLQTGSATGLVSTLKVNPPKDSIVKFRIFGNEENIIGWVLYPKPKLDVCIFFCDAVDTVASGQFTLKPQKFETVKTAVVY